MNNDMNSSYILIGYIVLSFLIMFILKILLNKNIIKLGDRNRYNIYGEDDIAISILIGFFWFLIIPAFIIFIVFYFVLKIPFMLADLICRKR